MENFSFCNPTQIEFGRDKEKNIGKYISKNGVKNSILCVDGVEYGIFDYKLSRLITKTDSEELNGIFVFEGNAL